MTLRRFSRTLAAWLALYFPIAGAHAEDDARTTVTVQIVSSDRNVWVHQRVRLDAGWQMLRPYHRVLSDGWSRYAMLQPVPEWKSGPYQVVGYAELCFTPCRIDVVPGAYHLALSQDGAEPVEAPGAVEITGPSRVETAYTSHRILRLAGWITAGVGVTAGVGLIGAGFYGSLSCDVEDDDCERRGHTRFLGGAALALASAAIGLGLAHVGDDLSVRIVPGAVNVARRF